MAKSANISLKILSIFLSLLVSAGNLNAQVQKSETAKHAEQLRFRHENFTFGQEIKSTPVYIKLEAEDFAGLGAEDENLAWQQNMSWYPHWSRGGASGWWGVKGMETLADGEITREIYIPQSGEYVLWMRYQDYTGKAEPFDVLLSQKGDSFKSEFGRSDIITEAHPKIPWNYAWDKKKVNLKKGDAAVRISLGQTSEVPRAVDALIITDDANWIPEARGFPPQAYANYLLRWSEKREPLKPLIENRNFRIIPQAWNLPTSAGRDFWYFGAKEMLEDYPFAVNIKPEITNPNNVAAFVRRYRKNPQSAPIFGSQLTGLQISIAKIGELLESNSALSRYILNNKRPFVLLGNYSSAGQVKDSYQLLERTYGDLWVGIVSGENTYLGISFYDKNLSAGSNFKNASYQWLFKNGKSKFQKMIEADWASSINNPFEKIIAGLSVGSMSHVHQLAEAGVKSVAAESAGAMPYVPLQMSFVRGAARQYKKTWAWYFGASFGDAIRTFTAEEPYYLELENLKIDNRNSTVGPSLAHIRRTLLFSYLQGANFFYPEQGYNLFDTGGELNPMGWSYDEMIRLAAKHPKRGVTNTPVALLLDKAHGWDKYTYYGMRLWNKKTLERADQMINQFFNVAYYPFPKNEGEPADDLNVPYPNGYFGDVFDVLVTSPTQTNLLSAYPVVFLLGDPQLDSKWTQQLKEYVNEGGTLVINAEQVTTGIDESFLGVKLQNNRKESSQVVCARDNEKLGGTLFSYQEATAVSAQIIARAANGDAVAFLNKVGKGQVILTTPSYLMGEDEVAMPYMAHLLLELTSGLQPINVRGNCQYFVNLRPDGYVVTLSNNEGLIKMSHSPAKMDLSKTSQIILNTKEKPLATEDWLGEDSRDWNFPDEWLKEYTQPKNLSWKKNGKEYQASVKLLPGEIRSYFIKTVNH